MFGDNNNTKIVEKFSQLFLYFFKNNKIIGAVTHVIVDNPVTGYGISIVKMLEEGEKTY